jgi:hypothetical protein
MRRSQLTEQRQIQTMDAVRERHHNSSPHRWRIFWSVLAGICWLLPALVWASALQGHPLRLVVGMFVTTICVYVIVPLVLRQKQRRTAEQAEPQLSLPSTYEQGYREQSAGATTEISDDRPQALKDTNLEYATNGAITEIPDDRPQFQSRSPWEDEQIAIDYPELPPPY